MRPPTLRIYKQTIHPPYAFRERRLTTEFDKQPAYIWRSNWIPTCVIGPDCYWEPFRAGFQLPAARCRAYLNRFGWNLGINYRSRGSSRLRFQFSRKLKCEFFRRGAWGGTFSKLPLPALVWTPNLHLREISLELFCRARRDLSKNVGGILYG